MMFAQTRAARIDAPLCHALLSILLECFGEFGLIAVVADDLRNGGHRGQCLLDDFFADTLLSRLNDHGCQPVLKFDLRFLCVNFYVNSDAEYQEKEPRQKRRSGASSG